MILIFRFKSTFFIWFIISLLLISCGSGKNNKETIKKKQDIADTKIEVSTDNQQKSTDKIIVGANRFDKYLLLLKNKNIAIVANQTSIVNKNIHLVDYLNKQFPNKLQRVFAPEHGFRGKADAGEHIKNGIDKKQAYQLFLFMERIKNQTKPNLKT